MRTVTLAAIGLTVVVLALAAGAPAAAEARAHSVDYVIGMLEAGMSQQAVLARIQDQHLTFRLAQGDLDRLRAAGAGADLVQAVAGEAGPTPDTAGSAPSSRPQRLLAPPDSGQGQAAAPAPAPADQSQTGGAVMDQGEAQEPDAESAGGQESEEYEAPHGGYPYYVPGYDSGWYGASPYVYDWPPYYYYSPFYVPYYYSFYYGYPSFYPRHFFFGGHFRGGSVGRTTPRGSPRGSTGGSHSSPRGTPRGHPRGH